MRINTRLLEGALKEGAKIDYKNLLRIFDDAAAMTIKLASLCLRMSIETQSYFPSFCPGPGKNQQFSQIEWYILPSEYK